MTAVQTDPIEAMQARIESLTARVGVIGLGYVGLPLAGRRSAALTPGALAGADAVLISTDHDAVDYALIGEHARLIVDTRNAFGRRGLDTPPTLVTA